MKPIQGYHLIKPEDLHWRSSNLMRIPNADYLERIAIEDFSTWIASKEDLIISKLWWAKDSHSEQQLRDVKNLASTGCDTGSIER